MGVSERRKFKAANRFSRTVLSRPVVINGLRIAWVVVLVWGELVTHNVFRIMLLFHNAIHRREFTSGPSLHASGRRV